MGLLKWIWARVTNALAEVLEEEYRQSFRGQFEKNRAEIDAMFAKMNGDRDQIRQVFEAEHSRRSQYNKPHSLN
jgi:aminoglycoside phosphotransferase (APT) family kinase protein